MAYNYAKEKRRFDAEWKLKELWYRKEDMSEDDIEEMRRFDLEQFNRDRAYESRRRPLETACGSCYIQHPEPSPGRYGWVDEINDPHLAERLRKLSDGDLELLTLIAIEGMTRQEAAKLMSCSHQNISRRIARIRKILS